MLDQAYIEELKQIEDQKEAKQKLSDYGDTFGISLKRTKTFDNMLIDLEQGLKKLADEPFPEDNEGVSIGDLIQASDENDGTAVFDEAPNEAKLLIDSIGDDSQKVIEIVKVDEPKIIFSEPLVTEIPDHIKETAASHGYEFKQVESLSDNTIEEAIEKIKEAEGTYKLPENYAPRIALLGRAPGYMTLPWWIYQWISETPDWKSRPTDFPHPTAHDTLFTLLYYIKRDGSVLIRETRDSKFITLQ